MKKEIAIPETWTLDDGAAYRDERAQYHFPFVAVDPTPGGSNLGRIEWHVELLRGRKVRGLYWLYCLLVWASQTRDPRYTKRLFHLPVYAESWTTSSRVQGNSYMSHVWRTTFCELHGTTWFSAYPTNEHSSLVVDAGSSISIEVEFQ